MKLDKERLTKSLKYNEEQLKKMVLEQEILKTNIPTTQSKIEYIKFQLGVLEVGDFSKKRAGRPRKEKQTSINGYRWLNAETKADYSKAVEELIKENPVLTDDAIKAHYRKFNVEVIKV